MRYVQYGSGTCAAEGWENYDASPTLLLERLPGFHRLLGRRIFPRTTKYGDIVRGLPVERNSCHAVYCSHVLEHLALNDFRIALRNTLRMLKPGAVFRLVVPDLAAEIRKYCEDTTDGAALQFLRSTQLGQEVRPRGVAAIRDLFGNSRHRWMWDELSMCCELKKAGFVEVRRAKMGDSGDPYFALVEDISRWEGHLGFSARHPQ